MTDVVLGYENEADYFYDSPCAGKTPGRFANRISKAEFNIDGKTYHLTKNDGRKLSCTAGPDGFHNQIWDYEIIDRGVRFSRPIARRRRGLLGQPASRSHISMERRQQSRYNLRGRDRLNHHHQPDQPRLLQPRRQRKLRYPRPHADHKQLEKGAKRRPRHTYRQNIAVEGTPFDFRKPKALGKDMFVDFENIVIGKGYNHYFFIDSNNGIAASLSSEKSGIRLDIATDMPGLMLYTGNWLDDSPVGRDGHVYHDHDGVAIDGQFPPDAPNRASFPSTILRPGEKYKHFIRYAFS